MSYGYLYRNKKIYDGMYGYRSKWQYCRVAVDYLEDGMKGLDKFRKNRMEDWQKIEGVEEDLCPEKINVPTWTFWHKSLVYIFEKILLLYKKH